MHIKLSNNMPSLVKTTHRQPDGVGAARKIQLNEKSENAIGHDLSIEWVFFLTHPSSSSSSIAFADSSRPEDK
jgi:hypothetical protein